MLLVADIQHVTPANVTVLSVKWDIALFLSFQIFQTIAEDYQGLHFAALSVSDAKFLRGPPNTKFTIKT